MDEKIFNSVDDLLLDKIQKKVRKPQSVATLKRKHKIRCGSQRVMWYQEYEYNISNYEYRCPKPTATPQFLGLNHAIVLTN